MTLDEDTIVLLGEREATQEAPRSRETPVALLLERERE